ncbi:glycosyltransferase family 39 protein [Conexibacter woesei]|uniref:Glycosyltransferase RgtA/B/C/D-like domain-containing protein n=1 Tax=Conexibacter woesei (strain DSM 14684 / CCUG 47730 / CIP 108061 / JCM 11494 / NBRC 100937 / ID131577) TaxID=469383 RepID=D3EYS6_CONWI|nr:glycosyltransferase family 39 protein [Conexibacter woesei]ADB49800.1 hypothetical protein Cwoe_1371 [Conexibacter woesei DSM 14684]
MPTEVMRGSRMEWWSRVPTRWRVAALLSLPYLVTVAALRGLVATMPTYHGGDEWTYHMPTIRQFAHQLPGVDLVDYPAAQTPLYHLLAAVWGELTTLDYWSLRIIGVVCSYAAALVVYRLLRRHSGLAAYPAVALAAVFAFSPYVFGQSFILGTDNPALLLGLLAIERLLAFRRGGGLGTYAAACAWIGLALLTRQSYVWLCGLAFVVLLLELWDDRRRAAEGLGLLALAVLPFAALLYAWNGPVPPGGDPASCGICTPDDGRLGWRDASPLRAPVFALAVLGVYGALLYGRQAVLGLRAHGAAVGSWVRTGALGAGGGVVLLLIAPLAYGTGDEGWLWRVARSGPELLGTAWAFWLLVPLGCAVAALGVRREGVRSLPVLVLGTFLAAQLATRLPYQKYFDPLMLFVCLLALRPSELRTRGDWLGPALVVVLAAGYAAAFIFGLIAVES